ncbi:uncharacterized protein LOC119076506 [Bradysia coprophila]|uniref:uncharacterized protein LOC119076506 n=1 Tax=Bradysia coprophila TaxID=38358 RepID=UPI00187D7A11|nr:uncharacterized protein LOC119076506 [Bradysia coprophila]
MPNNGTFTPLPQKFDSDKNWETYAAQLDQYFLAYEVTDDNRKRAMLLSTLSLDVFDTLTDLCFPDKPQAKTYKEICGIMKNRFTPTRSIFHDRRTFFDVKQKQDETVIEFATRLKQSIRYCKFEGCYKMVLRDKFVVGLLEGPVRSKVFEMDPTATFEACVETAIKKESINTKGTEDQSD